MKTNPIVAKTETVEVFRTVKLSLNNPDATEMTAADAVRQRMFETSHGTMDVAVTVKLAPTLDARRIWMEHTCACAHGIRRIETSSPASPAHLALNGIAGRC